MEAKRKRTRLLELCSKHCGQAFLSRYRRILQKSTVFIERLEKRFVLVLGKTEKIVEKTFISSKVKKYALLPVVWIEKVLHKLFKGDYSKQAKAILSSLLIVMTIIVAYTGWQTPSAISASYTFVQSSWAGGVDTVSVGSHPSNQTGWNKYYAASSTINFTNTSAPVLTTSTYAFTDDAVTSVTGGFAVAGGGFANGTFNNTAGVSGNTAISLAVGSSNVVNNWDMTLRSVPVNPGAGGGLIRSSGDDSMFLLMGSNSTTFYKYSVAGNTWNKLNPVPGAVGNGGTMLRNGTDNDIYVLRGNNTNALYKYNISGNSWTTLATAPGAIYTGGTMIRNGADDDIYVLAGNGTGFYKYSIAGDSWTTLTVVPITVSVGAAMIRDGADDFIYVLTGNGTGFYRYSIVGNSWAARTVVPGTLGSGSTMIRNGSDNDIYVLQGGGANLYRFSVSGNSWGTMAVVPGTIGAGGAMIRNGASDDIYVLQGGSGASFYKYSIGGNSWTTLTSAPNLISTGASMIRNGADNDIYVTAGLYNGFYKYSISGNTWLANTTPVLTTLPSAIGEGGDITVDDNYVYVAKGGGNVVYRHTLADSTSNWETSPNVPTVFNIGSALEVNNTHLYAIAGSAGVCRRDVSASFGSSWDCFTPGISLTNGADAKLDANYIYVLGGGNNGFSRHTLANTTDPWENFTALPGTLNNGGSLAIDANYAYVVQGNFTKNVYRHTLSDTAGAWETFALTPGNIGTTNANLAGHTVAVDSNYIYVAQHNSTGFYRHSLADITGAWTSYPALADTFAAGGSITMDGSYLYVLTGFSSGVFQRHTLADATSAWTTLTPAPFGARQGGGIAITRDNNSIYVVAGNNSASTARFIINETAYNVSGNFTSASINIQGQKLKSLSWNGSTPAAAGANPLQIQIATSTDNSTWSPFVGPDGTSGTYFSTSPATLTGSLTAGTVYIKYKAYLQTANTAVTPLLSDLTLGYDQYNPSGTIISSVYDSGDAQNVIGNIQWSATTPGGSANVLSFQIRTGADSASVTSNAWVGPDGTANTWFTNAGGTTMPSSLKDGSNDRYYQYRVKMSTTNGSYSPILNSVTATYVVNAPPEVNSFTASQNSDGSVTINYDVRDIDTTTGSVTPGYITPSFKFWNGSSYVNVSTLSANATTTKVVNADGSSWTSYSATWYPQTDYPGVAVATAKLRLTVDDREAANNTSVSTTANFALDTLAPSSASIVVDASTTPATVYLAASDSSAVQYKLSLNSDLAGASFVNLTANTTIALGANPATVYAQYKDAFSNTTTILSATTPETPASMVVQDISNMTQTPAEYRLFLAWKTVAAPTPGFSAYKIWRSINQTNWTLVGTINQRTINYFLDDTVLFDTTYYYRVTTVDSAGNVSVPSAVVNGKANGTQDGGEGGGGVASAPVITRVTTSTPTPTSETITWDTDTLSDSKVRYGTSPGSFTTLLTVPSIVNNIAGVGEHTVVLSGLAPNTTYYFKVESANSGGTAGTDDNGGNGYTFTTLPSPVITRGPSVSPANSSAVVTWTTNSNSDSTVFYSLIPDLSVASTTVSDSGGATEHSVTLTNLLPGTKYFFEVRSREAGGNTEFDKNVVNGVVQYYTFYTTLDVAAPTFSNYIVNGTTTTANIIWTTDEPADSQLEYGLTDSYSTTTVLDASLTTKHIITLENLMPNTLYHYRLRSRDLSNNLGLSPDLTFTTPAEADTVAPIITNVATSSIALTRATISWDTNEASNGTVDFGLSTSYGSLAGALHNFASTTHTVDLTDLWGNTQYYFRVNSTDNSGNSASSTGTFFTAADVTPPVIMTSSTLVNDTAAFINWTTDELTMAEVQYGLTPSFGDTVAVTSTYNTQHSLPLTGLTPSSTYYYQITTADPSANTTTIGPYTIETLGAGAQTIVVTKVVDNTKYADTTPPIISNLTVVGITPYSAEVKWTTDKNGNSLVKYGATTMYGGLAGDEIASTNDHHVYLVNLRPATTYHIQAETFTSTDVVGVSPDMTFTTLNVDGTVAEAPTVGISDSDVLASVRTASQKLLEQILSTIGENEVLKNISDEKLLESVKEITSKVVSAPSIVGLRPVVEVHGNAATIRWTTDKKTSGLVSFAKETEYKPTADNPYTTTVVDSGTGNAVSTVHAVELANLDPGTLYHFQVTSKAEIGPEAKSKDYTFQTEAVLPIISLAAVSNVTESTALVSWKTNVPTAATIEYTNTKASTTLTVGDTSYITSHGFTVKDLDPGSTYRLVIKAKNETNNETISPVLTFTTTEDTLPPEIINLSSNSTLYPGQNSKVQTIISWETNKPATGQVFYKEGVGLQSNTTTVLSSAYDPTQSVRHIVVITNFKPGTVYQYWVESTSTAGNHAKSNIFSVLTPIEKQTIIDIIGKNFQGVFGWTKNLGI